MRVGLLSVSGFDFCCERFPVADMEALVGKINSTLGLTFKVVPILKGRKHRIRSAASDYQKICDSCDPILDDFNHKFEGRLRRVTTR